METIKGDITDTELLFKLRVNIIAHGCNIRSIMGAGVALQIRNKFPEAYQADVEFDKKDTNRLGDYSIAEHRYMVDGRLFPLSLGIANLYQQDLYNSDNQTPLQIDKLEKALIKLRKNNPRSKIALPAFIGCGLARGDWSVVKPMVESVLGDNAVWIQFE